LLLGAGADDEGGDGRLGQQPVERDLDDAVPGLGDELVEDIHDLVDDVDPAARAGIALPMILIGIGTIWMLPRMLSRPV
jgi:hypothetical protein